MNHLIDCSRHSIAALLTACLLASGCSSTNPYQRSMLVDVPISRLALLAALPVGSTDPEPGQISNTALATPPTLAKLTVPDDLRGATPLAGDLHGALMALKDQRREWYDSLSTQARVRAVTEYALLGLTAITIYSGLKSGVASDSDKKRLAYAGGLGLAAYGASNWFINPNQERAYLEGIKSLTCAMSAIEPLRLNSVTFAELKAEQITLTAVINELDKSLLTHQATYRYPKDDESAQAQVRVEAVQALKRARTTLASSLQLSNAIDNSGVTLMREGDLVFSRVASDIDSANKKVDSPSVLATNAPSFLGKFTAIKIDPAEAKDPPPASPSPPMVAGSGGDKPSSPKPKVEDSKPIAEATVEELQLQIEALRKAEKDELDKDIAKAESKLKKINDAIPEKQALNIAKSFKNIVEACKKAGRSDCEIDLTADTTAVNLATQTAALYAARRPLSNRLLAFKVASKEVTSNKSCSGPGSPMTVSPSTDANVAPGAVYPITISGVVAPPSVTVNGPATFDYSVGPNANQYTYKVLVSADAKGQIDVAISDRGLAVEEITLTVVEKKKP